MCVGEGRVKRPKSHISLQETNRKQETQITKPFFKKISMGQDTEFRKEAIYKVKNG